jgi:branched-chain amino acid transport system substrate-binding protein
LALVLHDIEQRWAYETAVADINKAGGVMVKEYGKKLPLRLIVADDESDPGKAAAAVERLINVNKVDLLLGGFAAPFGVILGGITAEKYHEYYHTSICLIPPWLEHKFKWSTLYFFDLEQACSVPYEIWEGKQIAVYAFELTNYKIKLAPPWKERQ